MIQPAFPVVCDNCLESAVDWYAIGHKWICSGCWDPFGDFAHLDERRSANGVDEREDAMLGAHLKMRAAQGAGAGNSNDSSGLTTLNELVRSSDHG